MPEAMKESGIEWVGRVPTLWISKRAKYVFSNHKYIPGMQSYKYNRLALTLSGVIQRSKDDSDGLQPTDFNTYQLLRENELVFKLIDLQNISTSRVGLAHTTGLVSPAYIVLQAKGEILPEFAEKYYLMMWHRRIFNALGDSGVRSSLNVSELLELPIIIPPIEEQKRIADFLNEKCSEIDSITNDIQSQITTLEEYKKSIITEAVTKGLDPNVEMKDSGIEWIGQIPEGWSFPKITHILDYTHPYPIGDGDHGSIKATDYTEYGIPFIRVQNLGFATDLCLDDVVYISEAQNKTIQNSTLKPNDILFAKTGATIGKVGIVSESIKKANTTSHVGKITVSESIVPKYIFYVLSSNVGYRQFWDIAAQKSTRPELSIDEIKTIRVLLPKTKEEQYRIANYLDSKCTEIDETIKNKKEQLDVLAEYKKSLIYEYVTGKKEVK